MDWKVVCKRILERKEALKSALKDKVVEVGNSLIIYDDPLEIRIEDRKISFYLNGELAAILDESDVTFFDESVKDEVEMWCQALSSLGFKRYRLKSKR